MGEVYRPEDAMRKRRVDMPDIKPEAQVRPLIPPSIEALARDVEQLKLELERVKRALSAHGIRID